MTKGFPGLAACVRTRRVASDGSKPTCSTKGPHTCICIGISMRKSLTIARHIHGPETTLMGADPLVTADAEEATNETRNAVERHLGSGLHWITWAAGSLEEAHRVSDMGQRCWHRGFQTATISLLIITSLVAIFASSLVAGRSPRRHVHTTRLFYPTRSDEVVVRNPMRRMVQQKAPGEFRREGMSSALGVEMTGFCI